MNLIAEEIEKQIDLEHPETPENPDEVEEPETPENPEETTNENNNTNTNDKDDLENDFEDFLNNKTKFTHEQSKTQSESVNQITEDVISVGDQFKLQMFMSLMFLLLDGFHAFIYGFITKYKFDKGDFELDSEDQTVVSAYFQTKRVIDILNKIPTELLGIIHIEYIYFQKFQEIKQAKELEEAQLVDDYQDEVKEEEETPPPPKRKYKKRKKAKKKPLKKNEG